MKSTTSLTLTLAMVAATAGCAHNPPVMETTQAVTVVDRTSLPTPISGQGAATLGQLDKIRVEVFGAEDLTKEIQIDAGGRMSFPFVGSISVLDRTPAEVEKIIADSLAQGYLIDPKVTVNLLESVSQTIAVEGAVEEPGLYPAAGEITLLKAIALAGGASDYALEEQIVVFREVGEDKYAGVYNLQAVRRGLVEDPVLYPNDIVVIGESARRKAVDRILTLTPAFTSPLILLLTRL